MITKAWNSHRPRKSRLWSAVIVVMLVANVNLSRAEENPVGAPEPPSQSTCHAGQSPAPQGGLEGVQIETSDISLHESFFMKLLQAPEVQHIDHPQVDHLRGYCYRDMLVVVRQDVKTPRPTGWVQINFAVDDVAAVQQQLEQILRLPEWSRLSDGDRAKVVRLRLKPDVPRNNCRAARLEVSGPEGFMIGFDQFKPGTCKAADAEPSRPSLGQTTPHH